MTPFTVILAILRWPGTQPTMSPRSACTGRLGVKAVSPVLDLRGVHAGAASGKPDTRPGIGYLTTNGKVSSRNHSG